MLLIYTCTTQCCVPLHVYTSWLLLTLLANIIFLSVFLVSNSCKWAKFCTMSYKPSCFIVINTFKNMICTQQRKNSEASNHSTHEPESVSSHGGSYLDGTGYVAPSNLSVLSLVLGDYDDEVTDVSSQNMLLHLHLYLVNCSSWCTIFKRWCSNISL